ncbi:MULTISPECIES: inositol monophosphatase family protein [unclassified Streptococcus]|uniref:inositol monophosphatase family protein n=1 Tax=unclassified Streptococcus TaxID=2608887 RepID=UPI001072CA7E|nr:MULTISPECIES: inositol monophosphatase family protein [unclassified Streptococcus]MBF0786364.1 inositol monophosphatase family protein [Streptococcus sp. 19428wC2_LYSM12]MCQ9212472.1 inositol monophosphatase family protein [Streptococcus sp. B01]MCQ9213811.1 inositol monophosphatase family protein [Streptococcus sp. O1]TFV06773.1 inositol monophosphatase family protein [Streptococcus sp. LYSM12]
MEDKYRFAKEIVLEAGAFLRQHLHDDLEIKEKGHFTDLVTQLDKAVQDHLTDRILTRYPADSILGEESPEHQPLGQGRVWVIDPIDGTTNFIVQQADFAVLLAYFENGLGRFGLIYDVIADKLYHGGGDFPVYENERLLSPFQSKSLKEGLVGLNAGLYAQNYAGLADFADQTLGTRSIGSAGISFSHVLTGRLLAQASYIYPWDYAAASILGEKLGYTLMTTRGEKPAFYGREYVMLVPTEKIREIKGYLQ